MPHYIIGIDEAGRGALAGPVCVGAVAVRADMHPRLRHLFPHARDSKQMTPRAREEVFLALLSRAAAGDGAIFFAYAFSGNRNIDARGITRAVAAALALSLRRLGVPEGECAVRLDGLLRAPGRFADQTTIVRGDETEAVISLASIVAKVTRDRRMVALSRRFPEYGFERHKGYGTDAHVENLRTLGFCGIHRVGFCRGIMKNRERKGGRKNGGTAGKDE